MFLFFLLFGFVLFIFFSFLINFLLFISVFLVSHPFSPIIYSLLRLHASFFLISLFSCLLFPLYFSSTTNVNICLPFSFLFISFDYLLLIHLFRPFLFFLYPFLLFHYPTSRLVHSFCSHTPLIMSFLSFLPLHHMFLSLIFLSLESSHSPRPSLSHTNTGTYFLWRSLVTAASLCYEAT